MIFFQFILGLPKTSLLCSIATGVLSGICGSGILALAHRALASEASRDKEAVQTFFGLVFAFVILSLSSQYILTQWAQKILYQLRLSLGDQILNKSLRDQEQQGSSRWMAVFTDDIGMIVKVIEDLPSDFMNVTIVFGCFIYMLLLSPSLFAMTWIFFLIGGAVNRFFLPLSKKFLTRQRLLWNDLLEHFKALVYGSKALMQHQAKRADFFQREFEPSCRDYRRQGLWGTMMRKISTRWSEVIMFTCLGCFVFFIPSRIEIKPDILTGFLFALMFVYSPLSSLIHTFENITKANVALEQMKSLGLSASLQYDSIVTENLPQSFPKPRSLACREICFSYYDIEKKQMFAIGPLSLTIRSGEITFITGENGSGKTTFAKLLCGLYGAEAGELLLNDQLVETGDRDYGQLFSSIFSDSYVFNQLYGISLDKIRERAVGYLELLRLEGKVSLDGKRFSTTELSSGQQKRLNLLQALLEDRPIYLFDEWAANQSETFKKVFYENILIELKAAGKMVIVISHDQHYFGFADKIFDLNSLSENRR